MKIELKIEKIDDKELQEDIKNLFDKLLGFRKKHWTKDLIMKLSNEMYHLGYQSYTPASHSFILDIGEDISNVYSEFIKEHNIAEE